MKKLPAKIKKQLGILCDGPVLFDEPMAAWTSFRIGGPAQAIAAPLCVEFLQRLVSFLRTEGIPFFVMGKGTNLIVKDDGFRGCVISLRGFKRLESLKQEAGGQHLVFAEAGVYLPQLVKYAARSGISGLEFAAGIPGSVGGAIRMNAGSWGGEIKDRLQTARILDAGGQIRDWDRQELFFSYRSLSLAKGNVILSGVFGLETRDPESVAAAVTANLVRKRQTQPLRRPSAGSVFKNPVGTAAGKLIDMAGFKGLRRGQAMISRKHANFIVNMGDATASDVIGLMEVVQRGVRDRFGIELEPEVEIFG
ncbi:MAG: UDP-N-acetylmuramate dehydrogenase [Pseudomonadota bacterium]